MNKIIIGLVLTSILVLSGCEQVDLTKISDKDIEKVIKCDSPYIRHASGCCLDQNKNSICDNDETTSTPKEVVSTTTNTQVVEQQVPAKTEVKEPVCTTKQIPYTDTESYTTTEEYVDGQTCNKQEFSYEVMNKKYSFCWTGGDQACPVPNPTCGNNDAHKVAFDLKNNEAQSGVFRFRLTCIMTGQKLDLGEMSVEVHPNQVTNAEKTVCQPGKCDGGMLIEPSFVPGENVCEPITKTRDVQKTREVTKYRTEQVCQ